MIAPASPLPLDSPLRRRLPRIGHSRMTHEGTRTIIWLAGDQDVATARRLREDLDSAIAADDSDIAVDMSEVTFIDAATIGTLIAGRNDLRTLARMLTIRDSPPHTRRLLDVCELRDLDDASATVDWWISPKSIRDR